MCGTPLDLGWGCRCFSRFHGDFGLPSGVVYRPQPALPPLPTRTTYDAAARASLAHLSLLALTAASRTEESREAGNPGVC
jgi:hypothetical protein